MGIIIDLSERKPVEKLFVALAPDPELIGNSIYINKSLIKEGLFRQKITKRFIEAVKTEEEDFTRDIPEVSPEDLANLDKRGLVEIGSEIKAGHLLIGKVKLADTVDMTPEERLLEVIFREKVYNVKDASVRMPYEGEWTVTGVRYFKNIKRKEKKDKNKAKYINLPSSIDEVVEVDVTIERELKVGDILADPEGYRGTVVKICDELPSVRGKQVDALLSSASQFNVKGTEEKKLYQYKNKRALYDKRLTNRRLAYLAMSRKEKRSELSALLKKEAKKLGFEEIAIPTELEDEKYKELFEKEAEKYKFLGKAQIGSLFLEKETELPEDKIVASGDSKQSSIVSRQPILIYLEELKGLPKDVYRALCYEHTLNYDKSYDCGARITKEELSALKKYPTILTEALILRSDNSKAEKRKAYIALTKNGKFNIKTL